MYVLISRTTTKEGDSKGAMCLPVASNSASIFLPYFWVLILFCPLLVPTPIHSLGKTPPMSESPCVRRTSLKFGGSVLLPHHRQRFTNNYYTSLFLKFFSHLATRNFSLSYLLWGAPAPCTGPPSAQNSPQPSYFVLWNHMVLRCIQSPSLP